MLNQEPRRHARRHCTLPGRALRRMLSARITAGLVMTFVAASVFAQPRDAELAGESFRVPADTHDVYLYVRNRHPAGMTQFSPERTLLFVHGATYPAEVTFDLRLDGWSWMDYIASHGYDVWMLDLRGYGRSTRPPEMEQPPQANPPIVTTDVAVRDFGTAVDFVLARRNIDALNVMGWSWGTVTTSAYTAANPDRVQRLVLFAPIWLRDGPSPLAGSAADAGGSGIGAYRTVNRDAARTRWLAGVPAAQRETFLPDGWFDTWWRENLAADPVGAALAEPVVRAPNGVLEDSARYWSRGIPFYSPADIQVPVLLAVGEWDVDTPISMSVALLAQLHNAPEKRLVVIGGGTHTLLLEPNRQQLFSEVQLFLDAGLVQD
jgi:pimeloyl-ACP methyl ester carboxylesterase